MYTCDYTCIKQQKEYQGMILKIENWKTKPQEYFPYQI